MPWIFTYGSLMGDHALGGFPAQPARMPGTRRAFDNVSTRRWGTPEAPCPILGLADGPECWGVAYEVPRPEERGLLRALQKRDAGGAVEKRSADIELRGAGRCHAWLFATPRDRRDTRWADSSRLDAQLRLARGLVGTGIEYVRTLIHALELHDLEDPALRELWARVQP